MIGTAKGNFPFTFTASSSYLRTTRNLAPCLA
jgi:hypothetical protein